MKYEMMIPPFEHKDFDMMTKKEAQYYFEWFIGQVDHRINILNNLIVAEGEKVVLDYSIDSLIPLWKWYERKIKMVQKNDLEYKREIGKYPTWMEPYITKIKISDETLMIGLDISMYFAQVIIRNNNGKIKWGFFTKPKNRMSVNEPTLLGFSGGDDLNPRLVILNCIRRSSRERNERRLFDIYKTWVSYIE